MTGETERDKRLRDIHPSHDMGEWRDSIITLISTSRYGTIRECRGCEAEEATTVAGVGQHDELFEPCPAHLEQHHAKD